MLEGYGGSNSLDGLSHSAEPDPRRVSFLIEGPEEVSDDMSAADDPDGISGPKSPQRGQGLVQRWRFACENPPATNQRRCEITARDSDRDDQLASR